MKRLVCVMVAVCALVFIPSASAHPDYRPWKRALDRAWSIYANGAWDTAYYARRAARPYPYSICRPYDFDPEANTWNDDWGTLAMATTVTALYGEFPNGEFNPEMKRFLRPFLPTHAKVDKREIPLAPVVWKSWRSYMPSP